MNTLPKTNLYIMFNSKHKNVNYWANKIELPQKQCYDKPK